MARRVFFSFHYQRDSWRVNQVRNSWVTQGETNRFLDAASWEKVKKQGVKAIKRWIDGQLGGTSVTVVLIGKETASRKYVKYEIEQSYRRGNGLLGIYVHQLKNHSGETEWFAGENPFEHVVIGQGLLFPKTLASTVPIYDWIDDDGYRNISAWIEKAARSAGR